MMRAYALTGLVVSLLALVACDGDKDPGTADSIPEDADDHDGDGFFDDDCDDSNPDVFPGAEEICDGLDNDCDSYLDDADPGVDESTQYSWYTDRDGDGYGTTDSEIRACEPPYSNSVLDDGDCDDDDASVNPGELEVCNGIDDDCDGAIDVNAADGSAYYSDGDGDSYGVDEVLLCEAVDGYATAGGDCDDGEPDVNPGAAESCFNDIDDDCDGEVDDSCPVEVCGDITEDTTWTADGFGYFVACDLSVLAELTIEPGTVVYFAPATQMDVGVEGEGALIVDASDDDPVTFQSGAAIEYPTYGLSPGDWTGLIFGVSTNTFTTVLNGLKVLQAGGEDGDGAVVMDGVDLSLEEGRICSSGADGLVALGGAEPDVRRSTLCDNLGHGFYADDDSGLSSFSDNTLYGNADYPVSVRFRFADAMDVSNDYGDCTGERGDIELREDTLESDALLVNQNCPFYVSGDVAVYGSDGPLLDVEDGVSMAFAYGAGLQIGARSSPGDLTVNGSDDGVVMTAADTSRGWDGLTVEQGSDVISLRGLELSYGGNNNYGNLYLVNGSSGQEVTIESSTFAYSFKHGLYVGTASAPLITGSTFAHNLSYGVYIYDSGSSEGGLTVSSDASFVGNTLTDNGAPMQIPASSVDQLDDSSAYGADGDAILVTGSTVGRSGTWQLLDLPYHVTGDVSVEGSASPVLSIEADVTLEMDDGVAFEVGDGLNGGLKTTGSLEHPVLFTSAASAPAAEDWEGLKFGTNALSSSLLQGLIVEYAGGNTKGGVYVSRSDPAFEDCIIRNNSNSGVNVEGSATSTPEPSFTRCAFEDNEDDGLYVDSSSGLGDFEDNSFSGNGRYPVSVNLDYASALDSASTYSTSGDERVQLLGETLSEDSTWADLDAAWYAPKDINVSADLTLSAGTTVKFASGVGLTVGGVSAGSLRAEGTSGAPITLTSAESDPAAGDWAGVLIKSHCDASTLDHLHVEYGDYGLSLDCKSAIHVSDSTFSDAALYDLLCGSRATSVSWDSVSYDTMSGCTGL